MNDYALVYFDKRGVGKSEGLWYNTTFEQRALDAKNVALAIQKFEFVDHKNIYVIGHSQGGWIAQIALAEYPEVIKNFEAEPYLKQIKKPFLMLFAENDALVNLKWSMDALAKCFRMDSLHIYKFMKQKAKLILLRLHPNAMMQKKKVLTLKQQDNFYLIGFIQKIRKGNCFY